MKPLATFMRRLGKLEGLPIAIVLLVLYIVLIIAAPNVFQHSLIYMSFLETVPPTLIAALGLTLVITAGEIDLSFPAVVALSGFAFSWAWRTFDPTYGAWIGIIWHWRRARWSAISTA
jgi:simple sugar transport system permease protein